MTQEDEETESYDLSAMTRSELEAEIVSQANIIERFRTQLGAVIMGLEDEGDRVYFGSSNEADWLRDIEQEMLASLSELAMPWMHGRDLYADLGSTRQALTAAHTEAAELKAENERLREALQRIAGVCGPYGTPFPESNPDYPAFAVMEARAALKETPA